MNKSREITLKLEDAAKELDCTVDDIFENWSLNEVVLCINIVPTMEVYVIDKSPYDLFKKVRTWSPVFPPVSHEEQGIKLKPISGTYYLLDHFNNDISRKFVDSNTNPELVSVPYSERVVNITYGVLTPSTLFDDYMDGDEENITDEDVYSQSYLYALNHIKGYFIRGSQLRITRRELDRYKNKIGLSQIENDKELLTGERNSLLLTIGALADLIASERGAAFMTGDKPNKSRITEILIKHVGKDFPKLSSSSIQDRISKGLKLLNRAKKDY